MNGKNKQPVSAPLFDTVVSNPPFLSDESQTTLGSDGVTLSRKTGFEFAGLSAAKLLLCAAGIVTLCWGMWVTRELTKAGTDDVVSVRLSKIVGDFVSAQAQANINPDAAALQTAMYMRTLDAVLKERGTKGATILVAEAVIASTARDVTEDVRAETNRRMGMLGASVQASLGGNGAGMQASLANDGAGLMSSAHEQAPLGPNTFENREISAAVSQGYGQ